MSITIICPKLTCRAILRVPENVRGKRVRCSECGVAFLVPETSAMAASASGASKEKERGKK